MVTVGDDNLSSAYCMFTRVMFSGDSKSSEDMPHSRPDNDR